jgi:hypothetical protein
MLRVNNIVKVLALSTVMFGAGATVATVALSYLPMVNASSTKIAQGLKQSKGEVMDEENGLKFQFQNCNRSNQTIICNVLATNLKSENQQIRFHADDPGAKVASRVVDVSGNEYPTKLFKIGQKDDKYYIETRLIAGVPTKLSLSFQIPREVIKLAVLEVSYSAQKYGVAQLRDINIGTSQVSNPGNPADCTCPPQTTLKKPRPR